MKLVDKMILLTRMIKDSNEYELDVVGDIQKQNSFQTVAIKKRVKDKTI